MRMIQQLRRDTAAYRGTLQPTPFVLRKDSSKFEVSDWLSQSEQNLEELLLIRPLQLTKLPRIRRRYDGPRAPESAEWVSRGAELATYREIHNTRSSKVIGFKNSRTSNGLLAVESTLEADAACVFDWSAGTSKLLSQPAKLQFKLDGRRRFTTPDFGFSLDTENYLVEVKPLYRACIPEQVRRFQAIGLAAAAQGKKYSVLTERVIRRQPRLQNIMSLRPYSSFCVSESQTTLLIAALRENGPLSYAQIEEHFCDRWDILRPTLLCMVYHHVLEIDWDQRLDRKTAVFVPGATS